MILSTVGIVKEVANCVAAVRVNVVKLFFYLDASLSHILIAVNVISLCCENIVDSCVRVLCRSNVVPIVICAALKVVGLLTVCIIGLHILNIKGKGNNGAFTGLNNAGLIICNKINRCLFNTVIYIILSVGGLIINLNYFFTTNLANVLNGNADLDLVASLLCREVRPLKVCVRDTVTEWELYLFIIIIIACVTSAENCVLVSGFVVLITYVNAFCIGVIMMLGFLGTIVCPVLKVAHILHSGRAECVVSVCINKSTRGVNLTLNNTSYRRKTIRAYSTDPKAGINVVLVKESTLHRIGGVEKNDNLIEFLGNFL